MTLAKFLTKFEKLFKCECYRKYNIKIYVTDEPIQKKSVDDFKSLLISGAKVVKWSYGTGELTVWVEK